MNHKDLVKSLAKPGEEILESLTPDGCHLWHMSSAICGEAGELFDAIKRSIIHGKEMDRENVIEELGDIEFYLEGVRAALGISRQETIDANIAKLGFRYADGKYSDKAAQDRADKEEITQNYGGQNG